MDARGGKVVAKTPPRKWRRKFWRPAKCAQPGVFAVAQRGRAAYCTPGSQDSENPALPRSSPGGTAPAHRHPRPQTQQPPVEQLLRQNFINIAACASGATSIRSCSPWCVNTSWQVNTQPASYEAVHLSMLSGLLGNIGFKKGEERRGLPGAHGIRFHPHPART